MSKRYRMEYDSLGELRVPAEALYGAQTQRALENFPISGLRMPGPFIRALARIKPSTICPSTILAATPGIGKIVGLRKACPSALVNSILVAASGVTTLTGPLSV